MCLVTYMFQSDSYGSFMLNLNLAKLGRCNGECYLVACFYWVGCADMLFGWMHQKSGYMSRYNTGLFSCLYVAERAHIF